MSSATQTDYAAAMKLPEGKTCADCVQSRRCCAMGFSWPDRTQCDFFPSYFTEADKPTPLTTTGT